MQFNSNLLQSFLGQTKEAKATSVDSSNLLVTPVKGGVNEASNEFLSLLNETKALAESGVTPEEFIETLNDQDLGLSGVEKKALTNSFFRALTSDSEITPSVIKNELNKPIGLNELKETTDKVEVDSKALSNQKSDLSKIINDKTDNSLAGKISLNNKVVVPPKESEILLKNIENTPVDNNESFDPKIINGKLLTLKDQGSKKVSQASFQSSEDFVAQANVASAKSEEVVENNERKSFFPKSNNKVLAFNKEQNNINNNIFAGKNPFVNGNEIKATKVKGELEASNLDSANITNQAEALSSILSESQPKGNDSQNLFGSNSNVKVMDFSNINTANTEKLIDKISNYITTSRLENQEQVELIVKHDSLGQIKVTATKGQLPDQINLDIVSNSDKGHQFFKSNEVEMIKSLSNSGVKLNDVKISMGSDFNFQSSDKGDSQFNQGQGSQHSKHSGQQASSNQDQGRRDRREQMWNMYRERLGA